jgi:lysophospholipase L1-like esterase
MLRNPALRVETYVILRAMSRRSLAAVLAAVFAALVLPAAAQADPGPYVALGDSYTAAPLVPNLVGQPIACARSDHNYPTLVAAAIGATQFRDNSCSAAKTDDMTAAQPVLLGVHEPQFNALRPDATLVTIGIGGNDIMLVDAVVRCLELGLLTPTGTSCRRHFAYGGGGDVIVDRIAAAAPKIAATLQGIRARSPLARVLIVGYPDVAPRTGRACYPLVPLSVDDLAYLDEMLRRTNTMLAEQAAANDAEYVDTYDDSIGHDVCTGLGKRWFEGLIPTAPAFPIHPNALGEASMARSVLRVLGQPRPGPVVSALTTAQHMLPIGSVARFDYTLNRAGSVTFTLLRSRGGGKYGAQRVLTVPAGAGYNTFTLTARQLGRRPGLYRLMATPQGGAPQSVHFRIRRAS